MYITLSETEVKNAILKYLNDTGLYCVGDIDFVCLDEYGVNTSQYSFNSAKVELTNED